MVAVVVVCIIVVVVISIIIINITILTISIIITPPFLRWTSSPLTASDCWNGCKSATIASFPA